MASINGLYNGGYDISNRNKSIYSEDYDAYVNRWEEEEKLKQLYEDKGTLDFQDMLQLMVAQFQNQTIDDQASTSDMMNQLVQMSTMQAMNQMVDHMGELRLANVMGYAASLVDKEVTVGVWKDVEVVNDDGTVSTARKLEEICEKVVGMGTYNGQQVIFLEKSGMFYLSDILAVGKLPSKDDEKTPDIEIPDDLDTNFGVTPKVEHAYGCDDPDCEGECMEHITHADNCADPEHCKGECNAPDYDPDKVVSGGGGSENSGGNENVTGSENDGGSGNVTGGEGSGDGGLES